MKANFNISNPIVAEKMKRCVLLDIETSLVTARIFSTGNQYIRIDQVKDETRLLSAAGGSMYDLYTKGEAGVWGVGNHMFDTFKDNPIDDTEVLKYVWKILDEADTIVCHNARFDQGWLQGRFLRLGMKLPSPYKVVCTYKGLNGFNMNSKKLDYLSHSLIGTHKISVGYDLWDRCADGDIDAFREMMKYNIGDIYNTLFKVYERTCAYYPNKCVDLSIPGVPSCRVTGKELESQGVWTNSNTGTEYKMYINPDLGVYYRNRYKLDSKKEDMGLLVPIKL